MQYDLISIQLNTMLWLYDAMEKIVLLWIQYGTGMCPNPNTVFGKEIAVLQNPNANMLQMMHRDVYDNLYPMHTFKLMHHIANFYAVTPVRIGAFDHP